MRNFSSQIKSCFLMTRGASVSIPATNHQQIGAHNNGALYLRISLFYLWQKDWFINFSHEGFHQIKYFLGSWLLGGRRESSNLTRECGVFQAVLGRKEISSNTNKVTDSHLGACDAWLWMVTDHCLSVLWREMQNTEWYLICLVYLRVQDLHSIPGLGWNDHTNNHVSQPARTLLLSTSPLYITLCLK